ncbi:PatB family C-S lyase [Paenibacillus sp. P96]|uniref:cysteine-S-conjugate beta-lyase n=1 Tax=Paenibacillus zeirhizosphaerae TaxID=2987519 RepID=A0ABT9FTG9_9BACL|nr:PatB family C-S lyase [Paenibacillus sp. P96]MDP4098008.1 PatB family C-S lyase [Paenibacillus sp. P96]
MDFNLHIDRTRTASYKWDNREAIFGTEDVLPMWVADMDFQAPPAVIRAIRERVEHGVFGYTYPSPAYYESIINWMRTRHNWSIEQEWIKLCPGVVPALSLIVEEFTEPGDQVMIQTPVYPPFYHVVESHGRELVRNPLLEQDGRYSMDFEDMENKMSGGKVKLLILCSPHNPVGRVWTKQELQQLAEVCAKWNVLVVSDEIHADLVFEPGSHIPFASLSEDAAQRSIICTAPSKTFNIAGLNTANMVIPNEELRAKFSQALEKHALGAATPLGLAAAEAAYREGAEWLDALLVHVRGNMDYVRDFCQQHLPEVKAWRPEGTYLLWMDFRALGLEGKELSTFLIAEAKLGLNNGDSFGTDGNGFMRMNLGCTRATVEEAMRRLEAAVRATTILNEK